MSTLKPQSFTDFLHKASSVAAVVGALAALVAQHVPAGATSWSQILLGVAGALGASGLAGNVVNQVK